MEEEEEEEEEASAFNVKDRVVEMAVVARLKSPMLPFIYQER